MASCSWAWVMVAAVPVICAAAGKAVARTRSAAIAGMIFLMAVPSSVWRALSPAHPLPRPVRSKARAGLMAWVASGHDDRTPTVLALRDLRRELLGDPVAQRIRYHPDVRVAGIEGPDVGD